MKRIVNVPVLPGQPTDGSGGVAVHLLIQSAGGTYTAPHVLHPVFGEDGQQVKQQVRAAPARVRIACAPDRNPIGRRVGSTIVATPHTEEARAVTCPKCKASKEYQDMMARQES